MNHTWIDGPDGPQYHCATCGISRCDDHAMYDTCEIWQAYLRAEAEGLGIAPVWSGEMSIAELLKMDVRNSIRVVCGDYWMYFDNQARSWIIREHVRYQRLPRVLCETTNEAEAVAEFMKALGIEKPVD